MKISAVNYNYLMHNSRITKKDTNTKKQIMFEGLNAEEPDEKRLEQLNNFQEKWGLDFSDISLLNKALMRRGFNNYHSEFNRIEILGGNIFKLCIGILLAGKYPDYKEGELTINSEEAIKAENKLKYAQMLGIEDMMLDFPGAVYNNSNYICAFNSLIGAIYLNAKDNDGLEEVFNFITKNLSPVLPEQITYQDVDKSYATKLQKEVVKQTKNVSAINFIYDYDENTKKYSCSVYYGNSVLLGKGKAQSKKEAKEDASRNSLLNIEKRGI